MIPEQAYDWLYGTVRKKFRKSKLTAATKKKRLDAAFEFLNEQECYIFKQVALYGFVTDRAARMNSMDKRYVDRVFRRAVRKLRQPKCLLTATGINLFNHEGVEISKNILGTRVWTILKRQGIKTINDLQLWASTSASALFNIPGIGIQTIPKLIALCEPSLY